VLLAGAMPGERQMSDNGAMDDPTTLGCNFARALVRKDSQRLLDLMHPAIDFRTLTPSRSWEAASPGDALAIIFSKWFKETDEIEGLEALESDSFADQQRVGYRFSVSNAEGRFLVEQQAYISELDGRIGWMRVLCSGQRPVSSS
jgi:hypothetical protein